MSFQKIPVGFTADTYKKLPVAAVLKVFQLFGIRYAEVTTRIFRHPHLLKNISRRSVLAIHLPIMGVFGYDFSTRNAFQNIQADIKNLKHFFSQIPFHYAVFHPPKDFISSGANLDFFMNNLRQVPCPLILENTRYTSLDDFGMFYTVLKKSLGQNLTGICLDIPHAFLSGEKWYPFYKKMQKEIRLVHLSSCSFEEDQHHPFRKKDVLSLKCILSDLKRTGFKGIINFEINPSTPIMIWQMYVNYRKTRLFLSG